MTDVTEQLIKDAVIIRPEESIIRARKKRRKRQTENAVINAPIRVDPNWMPPVSLSCNIP